MLIIIRPDFDAARYEKKKVNIYANIALLNRTRTKRYYDINDSIEFASTNARDDDDRLFEIRRADSRRRYNKK